MIKTTRHSLTILIALVMGAVMGGCSPEDLSSLASGTLHLSIGHAATKTETRATPTQIGKPLAEKFNLKIQRSGGDYPAYEGKFVGDVTLNVGTYDIMAYYGNNVALGKNTPYYEGVATAVIEEDQSTSVTIPCRVANALVSVVFGRNEVEEVRFDRFYEDYGVAVRVGEHSLSLPYDEVKSCSVYFPAGSKPVLLFYGTLKETGERVWCELSSTALPETFKAADHAIVTLNLPDPESALNVDISKVEVVTAMLEETIPLSWLPISTATAAHHYDAQGVLVGTDVTFSNSYPGMQWKAVVTNAAGQEVRSIAGKGELVSAYNSSSAWPYLPVGDYKATFYLEDEGNYNKVGSRDFSIGKPELRITLGGYSSYTKYLEGDVDAANACDRGSVYDISVALNVSETLLAKFPYTFTYQYASMAVENVVALAAGKNSFKRSTPITGQAVDFTPYRLKANASFDGATASSNRDFYITGLPVTYAPPTKAAGWTSTGTVTFSSGNVELGYNAGQNSQSITNNDVAIPKSTKVSLYYDAMIKTGWAKGTTLTITIGENQFLSQSKGTSNFEKTPYEGTVMMPLTSDAAEIKCHNSYGLEQTYSCIYSLSLNYGK